jgi:hypothetical protein
MIKTELIKKATEEAKIAIDRSIQQSLEWQSIDEVDGDYMDVIAEIEEEVKKNLSKELGE